MPRYVRPVTIRPARTVIIRALLALAMAYVLILQGVFAGAAAGSRLAMSIGEPGLTQALCSGAQAPDAPASDESPHHATAPPSCCAWSASVAVDPVLPPTSPAITIPYLAPAGLPIVFGQATPPAILFRAATAQGSRAPPTLEA
ncbi:hypothetical protein SAMN05428997_12493 [Bosea sp. CRIB-10]|uniref:hypothetical protein n=1 Tax=Bosea sp. CRIB-10 TaxID=378404 RepID=UPI0008E45257|nr:hypothetical protein [Bosea sp. CRIB-10]SFD32580.1 hypothetical protein SAMN05428997_12493 [Bosea sp. CRIB-10]